MKQTHLLTPIQFIEEVERKTDEKTYSKGIYPIKCHEIESDSYDDILRHKDFIKQGIEIGLFINPYEFPVKQVNSGDYIDINASYEEDLEQWKEAEEKRLFDGFIQCESNSAKIEGHGIIIWCYGNCDAFLTLPKDHTKTITNLEQLAFYTEGKLAFKEGGIEI